MKKNILAQTTQNYSLIINTVFEKLTITILNENDDPIFHTEYFEKKRNAFKIDEIIDNAFKICDITTKDIKNVITFTGPGSFTGIKLGLSITYALICTHNVKNYGISLLDYLLFSTLENFKPKNKILALIPGIPNEYFGKILKYYKKGINYSFSKASSELVLTTNEIINKIKPDIIITDENANLDSQLLQNKFTFQLLISTITPKKLSNFIKYCKLEDNERFLELKPMYLKDTYAVKPKTAIV